MASKAEDMDRIAVLKQIIDALANDEERELFRRLDQTRRDTSYGFYEPEILDGLLSRIASIRKRIQKEHQQLADSIQRQADARHWASEKLGVEYSEIDQLIGKL